MFSDKLASRVGFSVNPAEEFRYREAFIMFGVQSIFSGAG